MQVSSSDHCERTILFPVSMFERVRTMKSVSLVSFWKTYLPYTTLQLLCLCIYLFSMLHVFICLGNYLLLYRSIHLFIYTFIYLSTVSVWFFRGSGGEQGIPTSPVTPILFQRQQMRVNSLDNPLCTGFVEREFDRPSIPRRISRRKSASRVGDFLFSESPRMGDLWYLWHPESLNQNARLA